MIHIPGQPFLIYLIITLGLLQSGRCFVQLDFTRHIQQSLSKRDAANELSLENVISYYRADIQIGTPPQPVSVQIDTGSSDLWVISTANPLCKSRYKCPEQAMFDTRRSSTFHRNDSTPFSIAYGDSTYANGTFAQDTIQIGGSSRHAQHGEKSESSGLVLKNANFAVAETSNSTEAVWGIGMESTESMARSVDASGNVYPAYPNIPVQMKQQGLISSVAYSLWLNDLNSSSGSLLFGGVDHAKYTGQLFTIPLVSSYHGVGFPMDFSVLLNGISAYNSQNETASLVNCSLPFLLDSGTTYSQMPAEFLGPIMETIGAVLDDTGGFYLLSQEQRAALSGGGLIFNLSGVEIYVTFDELLIPIGRAHSPGRQQHLINAPADEGVSYQQLRGPGGEEQELNEGSTSTDSMKASRRRRIQNFYLVGIYPVNPNTGGVFILGDTFLRSAYVVYDLENKEISLANTVYNTTDSQIENIGSDGVPSAVRAPGYSKTQVLSEVTTSAATELFISTSRSHERSSTIEVGGTATISQLPSHDAPGASSTASRSRLANHAKHNRGATLTPSSNKCMLLAAILTLLF